MNTEREPRSGRPLPGFGEPAGADGVVPVPELGGQAQLERAVQNRNDGLRRVRRLSNWTAAALVVGTGATAIALAHNAVPVAPPAFPGTATSSTTATGAAATHGTSGPQVGHTVATTSASGVTTTTTQLPNGKTVVTHSGHATYHDN